MNIEANKTKGIQCNRSLICKQENEYQEVLQLAIGFASVSIIRIVPCYHVLNLPDRESRYGSVFSNKATFAFG